MSGNEILVDAGPLVAWLISKDAHHEWACGQFESLRSSLLTCEPVLVEAAHIIGYHGGDRSVVMDLVVRRVLRVAFCMEDHAAEIARLIQSYRDVPMSLADACLVRMSEIRSTSRLFTMDEDFRVYRRHGRHVIPLIAPWQG